MRIKDVRLPDEDVIPVVWDCSQDEKCAQIMHKAPLTEPKQIEHVLNERRLLGAARNQFCVRLEHAFQDQKYLYLLQEWIPGV